MRAMAFGPVSLPQQVKNDSLRFGKIAHAFPPYKTVGKQNCLVTGNSTVKIPQAVAFCGDFANF
jgi:hypothetical protein